MDDKDRATCKGAVAGAVTVAVATAVVTGEAWLVSKALCLGFDLPWAVAAGLVFVTVSLLGS